jgi:hypothetical protein
MAITNNIKYVIFEQQLPSLIRHGTTFPGYNQVINQGVSSSTYYGPISIATNGILSCQFNGGDFSSSGTKGLKDIVLTYPIWPLPAPGPGP